MFKQTKTWWIRWKKITHPRSRHIHNNKSNWKKSENTGNNSQTILWTCVNRSWIVCIQPKKFLSFDFRSPSSFVWLLKIIFRLVSAVRTILRHMMNSGIAINNARGAFRIRTYTLCCHVVMFIASFMWKLQMWQKLFASQHLIIVNVLSSQRIPNRWIVAVTVSVIPCVCVNFDIHRRTAK